MLEVDLNLNMLGSDTTENVSATLKPIQYNSFDDCSSSSDNEDESYEEDIIVGLSNFRFGDPHGEKYITKSPHLNSPNRTNSGCQRESLCELSLDGIPVLPELNVLRATNGDAKTNDNLPTPRLLVHNRSKGEITPVLTSVYLTIHPRSKTFGFQLKRTGISEKTAHHCDTLQFLFQPDPHLRRVVHCEVQTVKVAKENGNEGIELQEQFVSVQPFVYKNLTTIEALLDGVPESEVETAMKLIASHDAETIFKSYGPNNDSFLMTLCCKRDDTSANRARVYALVSRVLRETDQGLRKNLSSKNLSGLTALDYTTVTNNAMISVFLAEMFYLLGQDVLCMDGSGNTVMHIMARKGDAVSRTLDALLSISYRCDQQKFVFNSNVANSKGLLPLHIACMSPTCPTETLSVLINNNSNNISAKTKDGSLPIHLACQYSSDATLLERLLTTDSTGINDAREDGLTPIHLVASRNDDQEAKIGLMPLSEDRQVEMLAKLISFGADKNSRVEDYLPIQLVRQGRSRAKNLLASDIDHLNELRPFDASPPHVMTHPTPPLILEGFSRPSSFATDESDISERNQFAPSETDDSDAPVHLEAIAHALMSHPTLQAVIDAAAEENNFEPNNDV